MISMTSIEVPCLIYDTIDDDRRVAELARRLHAFGNPVRLRILRALERWQGDFISIGRLVELVGMSQSSISKHVALLVNAKFLYYVVQKGPGRQRSYFIDHKA